MPSWTSSSAWCAVRRWRPPRKGDGSWPRGRWPPACRWRSPRTPRRVAIGLTSRPGATWSPSRGPPRSTAPSTSRRASKGCAKSGRSRSRSRRSRLSSPSRQSRRSNSGQSDDALAWPSGRERGVRGAVGRLGDAKLEALALTASYDLEHYVLALLGFRREALEMLVVLDWRAVERDDHVVLRQARHRGGAPRVDAGDHRAARVPQAERLRELRRERLQRDADPATRDLAAVDELARHALDHVGGDREADALARRDDRGVDPDDLAAQVHERPARVAGIDRRVRLDEVLVGRDADVRPPRRAHDADGDRLVEPERVTDRDRPLADAERVRVAERRHGELHRRFEADHGEVGLRVGADDPSAGLLVRGQTHRDAVGATDDVEIGQDVAPLVDDDARPQTRLMELLAAPGAAAAELVEKVLECGVVRERPERGRMAEPGDLHGPDVDDGGPNAVGHVDKGRLQGVGRVC